MLISRSPGGYLVQDLGNGERFTGQQKEGANPHRYFLQHGE
jgi:hypothetical protein